MISTAMTGWLRIRSNRDGTYWTVRSALVMASAALLLGVVAAPRAQAQFSLLHSFSGADGANPQSVLIMNPSTGNLYGTTTNGTTGTVYGTVFQLSSSGSLTSLESFSTTDSSAGLTPFAGLVMDSSGDLYGTTAYGGAYGRGSVFELTPNSAGGYNYQVVYSFGSGQDGATPSSSLIIDGSGNLYGTTVSGGNTPSACSSTIPAGCGTVFMLSPSSSAPWLKSTLYAFSSTDGQNPTGSLILDSAGNLYGTTEYGGRSQAGTVFMLTKSTSAPWVQTQMYTFAGSTDGANPYAGVIRDSSGNLYGTTVYGGSNASLGSVFEISPSSQVPGTWTKATLWAFTGGADGANPYGVLILDPAGNLDGTTTNSGVTSTGASAAGTVFSLSPTSSAPTGYSLTTLHTFSGADGANPYAGLFRDSLGNLYGTTLNGGSPASGPASGTVFKIAVQSPQTIIQGLINSVNGMSGNPLNSGGVTSLVQHLQHDYRLVYQGNYSGAIIKLQAFISEVQGLETAGTLTVDQANALINPAQTAINLLTAML